MKQITPFLLVATVFVLPPKLQAQQSEPAVEIFALTGRYYQGNQTGPVSDRGGETPSEWATQFGGGILVPLGRNWGALVDVTTSVAETYWTSTYAPGDNSTRERRIALLPSIARFLRTNRFSIYGGAGLGLEHKRQRAHFRHVIADEFQDVSRNSTDAMLVLRIGTIVSLSRKVVFRADLSYLPRYTDAEASKSLAAGLGYRF